METLTAVDAATGKEIAVFSDSREKPNEVYGRGNENFAYNPDIGNWDKNEDFLAFCGEVTQYLSEQQPQSSQEE